MRWIKKIFGDSHKRAMKKLQPLGDEINGWEDKIRALSDDELKAKTPYFKEKLDNGASLDDILPEAFSVVRETGRRVLGMRHYDVQMLGGVVLHQGKIAEMKTGEGKTLVATAPLYLNALEGKGAHLVTVNDYLASRDADWMGQIYKFLGLSVGKILTDMATNDRQESYACDITYGTNNEFGFDYLRDNMKFRLEDYVQRPHHYAIVDEVDSILIDEARTPLIISGSIEQDLNLYRVVNEIVPSLKKDEDYVLDEKHHSATLTDDGVARVEKRLGLDNIYDPKNIEYLHHVNKALQAHTLYKKDVNYIVTDGKVVIVDEHTGRPMPGRRWSDGLHQAVEAKEGVTIQRESRTLATITFQNFFRMYDKLAGMTGTADTEAPEFKSIYELDVVVVPTNKPIARLDQPDLVYRSEREKIGAIVDQIAECHKKGQPVLVGTVSVEKSEVISKVLKKKKIPHSVLNAKFHKKESEVVAQAGRKGAVTIATNMAGRGTDILLGGNPDHLARKTAQDEESDTFEKWFEHFKRVCAEEHDAVMEAGGLFVLGTERHESRRIDNQLRGRAGRQGDPGESRFFLSLEDDLMRIFGGDRIGSIMDRLGMEPGVPIEHNMVTKAIANAQKRVEGRNFDIRKHLLEYDDVMNAQRKAIYDMRHAILEGKGLRDMMLDVYEEVVLGVARSYCADGVHPDDWDLPQLKTELENIFNMDLELVEEGTRDEILVGVWKQVERRYKAKEDEFQELADRYNERYQDSSDFEEQTGGELLRNLERRFFLREIDNQWRDHLSAMTSLRDAVGLRGYGQKDPKQEYKREGYDMFVELLDRIRSKVATQVFRVQVESEDELPTERLPAAPRVQITAGAASAAAEALRRAAESRQKQMSSAAAAAAKAALDGDDEDVDDAEVEEAAEETSKPKTVVRTDPKLRRNDPCWCGSGKKYKHCHLKRDQAARSSPGA